jgi:hypothetical protein
MRKIVYDLCVIGSGPAGIILVLEFLKDNPTKEVVLIEFGKPGIIANKLDDSIVIKTLKNHHTPYECTNKGLGGTSLTWGGRCVMYDEIDFLERPVLEGNCTWDVSFLEETKPYLASTAAYFECGHPVFNLKESKTLNGVKINDKFEEGIVTDTVVERWSMPTRFGKRYRKELETYKNLTILEGYEARDFSAPDSNGKISYLTVLDPTNTEKTIEAKQYVLASGAQETTRLLLKNTQLFKNLPSVPSALGKFYQGHLFGKIASIKFYGEPKKTNYSFLKDEANIFIRQRFQFTTGFLLEKNLLNTAFWLDNPLYSDYKHKNGSMSLMYLVMLIPFLGSKLAPPAIAYSITKGKANNIRKHIWNVLKDMPGSLLVPFNIFVQRYFLKRKLPGVFLYSSKNTYAVNFHAEQIPSEKNRMELEAGTGNLNIYYEYTETDINSVIKLHEELDRYLRETNCGELIYWYKKEDLFDVIKETSKDGVHQIGTTRIADTHEKGVVDRNLKLFGTDNIYICSSSVFPTSGQANPTFFLGAFSVRLAKHLSKS